MFSIFPIFPVLSVSPVAQILSLHPQQGKIAPHFTQMPRIKPDNPRLHPITPDCTRLYRIVQDSTLNFVSALFRVCANFLALGNPLFFLAPIAVEHVTLLHTRQSRHCLGVGHVPSHAAAF